MPRPSYIDKARTQLNIEDLLFSYLIGHFVPNNTLKVAEILYIARVIYIQRSVKSRFSPSPFSFSLSSSLQ